MKKRFKKYCLLIADFGKVVLSKIRKEFWAVISFVFAFVLVFSCVYMLATRSIAIKKVRYQIAQLTSYLNEFDLDIAYDKIEFNSIFFSPLVRIEGFQLYNTRTLNTWALKFKEVRAYPNIIGETRVRFDFSEEGQFVFNEFLTTMVSRKALLEISCNEGKLNEFIFHANDINIHNLAKIKKAAFLLQQLDIKNENTAASFPSYDAFFEINDVDIDGLIDYPLSSHLNLIYAKASVMGVVEPDSPLTASLETWLKQGGFIEVPNLVIQWAPLTLVGRGSVYFNEYFSPRIHFNTSSKGLLRLLSDLQKNNFLNSKNVFVANILLSNKAFKLNPDDKELTISTPISYSNGRISIENMTIKEFQD